MTKPSVKCQQPRLGPFPPNTGHHLIKGPQRSHYCIIFWVLTAQVGWQENYLGGLIKQQ